MAVTQLVQTLRSPFNQGPQGLYAVLVAWLAAHTGITIQSVDWYRPQSTFSGDQSRLRIAYIDPGAGIGGAVGATWIARLFQTTPTQTAQDAFIAAFGGGLALTPFFMLDVTNHERTMNDPDSLLVFGVQTDGAVPSPGLLGHDRAAFIAQPTAPIAAGSDGPCAVWDASGRLVGSAVTVTNVGAVSWSATDRNYVVYDELTGKLIALPSCCAAAAATLPPASTTTTPFPCPAYLPDAPAPVL